MSGVDYGREALDFIEGLNGYNEVPAAMDALERAFGRFGFETIIVTGLPNPDQNFSQMVLAKRWPAEWFKLYTENNFVRVDPVVRHCRRLIQPFEWAEAPYDPRLCGSHASRDRFSDAAGFHRADSWAHRLRSCGFARRGRSRSQRPQQTGATSDGDVQF
jgi:hypothetical protein